MLKKHCFFVMVFLVNTYCCTMDDQSEQDDAHSHQLPIPKEVPRPRVVTFSIPLDDKFVVASSDVGLEEKDPSHHPMKHSKRKSKKNITFGYLNGPLEHDVSSWKRFMSCLLSLAYEELDDNVFYRSLRD